MLDDNVLWIVIAVLAMATLYSTVGHGGGSGYLAVLAIAGIVPEHMKPTALILNIIVSSIAMWKFGSSGKFRLDLFVPLICVSVPAAFLGGFITIPPETYTPTVGVILLLASLRLCIPIRKERVSRKPRLVLMLLSGVFIGVLSGAIGIGGGIFLSPLVLLLGWATAKQTAAISAPFILVNSLSALSGLMAKHSGVPVDLGFVAPLAGAVVIGGMLGASFGSRRLGFQGLRTMLGVVLFIASIKMFVEPNKSSSNPSQDATTPIDVKSSM